MATLGSPEPPSDCDTPVTQRVSRRMRSMSAWVVPDVLGGDVAAAEGVDVAGEGP